MLLSNGIAGNDEIITFYDPCNIGNVSMNNIVGLKFDNFNFKQVN